MSVIRYENGNTGQNEEALISIIKAQNTKRVILFASPETSNEPDTNLPLVSALAEYEIPGAGTTRIVYDGLFLTAARRPRYLEVKNVLDSSEKSEIVFFSTVRAPFTSEMPPHLAAKELASLGPLEQLTSTTRPEYFSMLSNITEENYP